MIDDEPRKIPTPLRADGKKILIAGGTGFIGTQVRHALIGNSIRVLARSATGDQGAPREEIEFVSGNLGDPELLAEAVKGCWAVVNLVAIIDEREGATFDAVIRQGTENLVKAAEVAGAERFVQISALGARNDPSLPYFEAKWRAEEAVKASGLNWTILRPSIVFGPGDGFVSLLAGVVKKAPLVPILGSGESKFQPVSVIDAGNAIAAVLANNGAIGKTFDLAGLDILTLREMMLLVTRKLGVNRPSIRIPIPVMKLVVTVAKPLPEKLRPPITLHQLNMLRIDNISADSATERLIGHPPRSFAGGIDYILSDST